MEHKKYGRVILSVLVLAMLATVPAIAQVLKGSISGSVFDPQGAVVSGAEVKATQAETGAVYITQSDNSGVFRLNLLPTGHYKVEITAQNFRTSTNNDVTVVAGSDNALGNVRLSIGGDTVAIEPSATAQALMNSGEPQITNPFSGPLLTTFSGIQENEGLDRQALFVPGAVNTRSNNFSNVNGAPFSINGLRGRNNDQQIDGQYNNDNDVAGPTTFLSDPNFVQQYVVTTNNFSPEYGHNSGSVVNIITKTGTNAWHGSLYGADTHSAWNAFSATQKFNRSQDIFIPNNNNEFSGFTIGGPMIKNKLFIFGGFDDQIINTDSLYRTTSRTPTPTGLAQLAAPGCSSTLNANALAFLNKFTPYAFSKGDPTPLPTNSTTGTFTNINIGAGCPGIQFGGVQRLLPTPTHIYNTILRGDLDLGRDTISGRYLFNYNKLFNLGDNGGGGWVFDQRYWSHDLLYSWTHNFNAHMINEARASYGRFYLSNGGNDSGNPFYPDFRHLDDALTNVTFNNTFLGFGPATNLPQARIVNTWQGQDNWNYVLGRHQLKAGVNYSYQRSPYTIPAIFNGQFRFTNMTSFLTTDLPNRVELTKGNPETDYREHNLFMYFGDDWKVTPNLRLNLGLTWSYFSQPINVFHDVTARREDSASTSFWDPSLPLSVRTAPSISAPLNNFGPGVGFAYSPQWGGWLTGHGKTVFRGGYRLLYDPAFYNIYVNAGTSAPNYFLQTATTPSAFPLLTVPTGAAVRGQLAGSIVAGLTDPRTLPQTIVDPNFRPDRVHTWTFGFERELTRNSVFEARYVGNHATDLFQSANANPFIADLKTDFPNLVPDNLTPCPASQAFNPVAVGRVNCNEGVVRSRNNSAFSYYNGLQLEFRANNLFKQLTMRTGYTWSKTLDNTSEIFSTGTAGNSQTFSQIPFSFRQAEYGISGLDTPQVFTVLFNEQLPFFREQHGVAGHLLGGWALTGNYIAASGQPYTPLQIGEAFITDSPTNFYDSGFINAFIGNDVARPFYGNRNAPADSVGIFAGDACMLLGVGCAMPTTQLISMNAINQTAAGLPPAVLPITNDSVRFITNAKTSQQVFGTPFGNVPRGALRDAPQNIFNFTISKQTQITERMGLEFHLTAINALNHFNFNNVDAFTFDASTQTQPNTFSTGFAHPEVTSAGGRVVWLGAKITF
jgi:hypothetical protein